MKRLIYLLFLVLLASTTVTARTEWTINGKAYEVDTLIFPHPVGPGVTFAKYDVPAMPLKVSVMTMDLTNKYIDFETCKSGDRGVAEENPLSMARRNDRPGHEVVGATNGDFYFYTNPVENGIPRSGQFRRDECVTNPVGRACFVLDDNRKPYIDRVDFAGRITHKDTTFRLHTVNMQRLEWENTGGNQINLYTNSYGLKTENCSGGVKALIHPKEGNFMWWANRTENCIIDSVFDGSGVTAIPEGHAVLWARGTCINQINAMMPGDEIAINLGVNLRQQPGLLSNFKELMGGSNHIFLKNGVNAEDQDARHPRTCIGFNSDSTKVFLVVIDGRSIASTGVTLFEAADVFRGLGAANAVNLDGGGSSCMVVNNEVVNTPSDGSLRAVGNGCLLISNAPANDSIGMLNFAPRSWNISISAKVKTGVWGYNKYGVLKTKDLQGCTFSCDPQVGTFNEDGTLVAAAKPATGNIYAEYNGITTAQPVNILNAKKVLGNDSVLIDKYHQYEIKVLGLSGYQEDIVDPSIISWISSNEGAATVGTDGIVKAVADGKTLISGTGENFNDTVLVSVENPKAHITNIENSPIDPATWSVTMSGGKDVNVSTLDNGFKVEFTGASSRNPYLKLTKKMRLWGIADTLRIRFCPNGLTIKRIKLSTTTPSTSQTVTGIDINETITGEYVLNIPVSQLTDAGDLSNYPLGFNYLYFNFASPTSGQQYSFEIPGIELIYGQETSGVAHNMEDKASVTVYPNPIEAGATLHINVADGTIARVFDLQGRLVKEASVQGGMIGTPVMASGIYLLKIDGNAAIRLIVK